MEGSKLKHYLQVLLSFTKEEWNYWTTYYLNSIDLTNEKIDKEIAQWHGGYGSNSLILASILIIFLTIHKCYKQRIGLSQSIYFIFIYTTLFIYFISVAFSPSENEFKELVSNKTVENIELSGKSTFCSILNPNPWFWSRTFTPLTHSTGTYYASLLYFALDGSGSTRNGETNVYQNIGKIVSLILAYLLFSVMVTVFLIFTLYPYDTVMFYGEPVLFIIFISVMMQTLQAKRSQINHQPEREKANRAILKIKKIMTLLGMQCIVGSFFVMPRRVAYNFNSTAEWFLLVAPVAQCGLLYELARNLVTPAPSNAGQYAPVQKPSRSEDKPIGMYATKHLDTIDTDDSSQVTAESGLHTPKRIDSLGHFEQVPEFTLVRDMKFDFEEPSASYRNDSISHFEQVPEFNLVRDMKFDFEEPGASYKNDSICNFEQVPEFTLVRDMKFDFEAPNAPTISVSYGCFTDFEPIKNCSDLELNVSGVDTPIRRASNEWFESLIPAFTPWEFVPSWSEPHTPIRRASMEYFDRIPSMMAATPLALAESRARHTNKKNKCFATRKSKSLMTID